MQIASNKLASVVIVAAGKSGYLEYCLESLKNQTYKNFEVIVIDNSLNPNFNQYITRRYKQVKLFPQQQNLFYAGGLNKGIDMAQGEFILCLNDDVILEEQFIERALGGFYIDNLVGMVGGKVLRFDKKTIDSAGLFLTGFRTAKEMGYGTKDRNRFDSEGYIFGVTGAVAFFRRKMLEDVKIDSDYFDSDFRMFYEDLDIAWRARLFGWKAYYIPGAVAYHARGASARGNCGINKRFARRYLNDALYLDLIKNRHLSIIKNESFLGFLLHLPFIFIYDLLSYFSVLLTRPQLFKKLAQNLRYANGAFKKRKILRRRIRI